MQCARCTSLRCLHLPYVRAWSRAVSGSVACATANAVPTIAGAPHSSAVSVAASRSDVRASPFPAPSDPPLIVAETTKFVVVSKPPFMLVHPAAEHSGPREMTLIQWLVRHQPAGARLGLVQRLDRETSGAILVGKDPSSSAQLGRLMMGRRIRKDYVAIVRGCVRNEHGTIDAPIRPAGRGTGRVEVVPIGPSGSGANSSADVTRTAAVGAQPSRTEYWRLCGNNEVTLLRLRAHTGRLHQLRVHLEHIGHPVLGDKQYGCDPQLHRQFLRHGWSDAMQAALGHHRHALHSFRLQFRLGGVMHRYHAPLPSDLVERLRAYGLLEAWQRALQRMEQEPIDPSD